MKKTVAAIIISAFVITLGGTTAFAFSRATGNQNDVAKQTGTEYNQYNECTYCGESGHCFTDSDDDGICDHRSVNTNGTGTCYNHMHSTSHAGCVSGSSHSYDGSGHHAEHRYGHR